MDILQDKAIEQVIDSSNNNKKKKYEEETFTVKKFDQLKMFYGEPYNVTDKIIIYQPSIGDILKDEELFYQTLNIFVSNPTSYRLKLWKIGIDWNKISEFELFKMLMNGIDPKISSLLFRNLDFSSFSVYNKRLEGKEEIVLYDPVNKIEINKEIHNHIVQYLRTMFNIFPKVEKARGKATKEAIIFEDEQNLIDAEKAGKETGFESFLLPLISSCLIHPGFKYKKNELKEVGIYEFMQSVQRIQVYETSTALLKGAYSGFIDTSKLNNEEMNFMRNVN